MHHALHLIVLLVATRLGGALFARTGQPASWARSLPVSC